jgi:predicted O-linked N-acetylglucosamine transferase (SPINDLY family)
MSQITDNQELQDAVHHQRLGQVREAEAIYRRLLRGQPDAAELHYNLAGLLSEAGRLDEAAESYRDAIGLNPLYSDALNNLALVLLQQRRLNEASDTCRQAIAAAPNHSAAHNNLGNILRQRGCLDEAIDCYRQAAACEPPQPATLNNLGTALQEAGQLSDALRSFHEALLLDPTVPETHNHLGVVLKKIDRLDDALLFFQEALQLRPGYVEAMNNLGLLFKDMARLDEAIACFERALAIKPPRADVHSNLIYTLLFQQNSDRKLSHELQRWNMLHAKPFEASSRMHDVDAAFPRRLRIGYVSPDFRDHCAASFLLPLIRSHDREKFEVHCFADVLRADAITRKFISLADHWHSTAGWSDEEMADRIRDQRIDILIDCTLHMAKNRLLVFARKPAPMQITWLGYPGSTGLQAIDYRITDPHLEPLDDRGWSEEPHRLPDAFWCYDPLAVEPVNDLPALSNGYITFGCLNNFCKLNEPVLKCWAGVLRANQRSRLILLAPSGSPRRWVLDILKSAEIEPTRVQFEGMRSRVEYLKLYHQIDLALDTFPYNGHTTSLDSFWMGVPVVTLAGPAPVSRAGVCQLRNLGLDELIADNLEKFVQIASALAGDPARLSGLRRTLRQRLEDSPLMNAKRFARNIESAYIELWERKISDDERNERKGSEPGR